MMNEPPLDTRRAWGAVTRHRGIVVVFVLCGMIAGLAYSLLAKPATTAQALVLLPTSPIDANGQRVRDMDTEIHIATSTAVLGPAGKALPHPTQVSDLHDRVHVSAPTPDILQVRAHGRTPRDARELADAVAKAYVTYTLQAGTNDATDVVSALQRQAGELERRLRDLQAQVASSSNQLAAIPADSPNAARLNSVLDSLRTAEADASSALESINSRIGSASITTAPDSQGTRVLERAVTVSDHWLSRAGILAALGALVGLLAGTALAVWRSRGDKRLRTRDEIAAAIGVPVIASLTADRVQNSGEWAKFLERYEPGGADEWAARQALSGLGISDLKQPERDITVVALARDRAALLSVAKFAAFTAGIGITTELLLSTQDPSAAPMRVAYRAMSANGGTVQPNLRVRTEPDAGRNGRASDGGFAVSLVVARDGWVAMQPSARASATVLAVSSGFATAETLASVAVAAADGRHPLLGVVVVNPDPDDVTTGYLSSTSRSAGPPLPSRVTGIVGQ